MSGLRQLYPFDQLNLLLRFIDNKKYYLYYLFSVFYRVMMNQYVIGFNIILLPVTRYSPDTQVRIFDIKHINSRFIYINGINKSKIRQYKAIKSIKTDPIEEI